jgi:hypothetical protein
MRISKRCGIRRKADLEIKPSVTGYWPNKATDAGAIGGFILNEHGLIWGDKLLGRSVKKEENIISCILSLRLDKYC